MKMRLFINSLLTGLIFLVSSCDKTDTQAPIDPCQGVTYNVQFLKTEAVGTSNNGTINITYPVGDTISYSLNTGAFQPLANFTNLAPGNYVVTVKNAKGCTDTAQIKILNYGPKYAQVKYIISGNGISTGGYCGPCHLNGTSNGGKNFDTDASIVSSWDRIKARAVDNLPTRMPEAPNAPLTAVDKQKITDWVNAGHRQSD